MVIPLLANQDLTTMLPTIALIYVEWCQVENYSSSNLISELPLFCLKSQYFLATFSILCLIKTKLANARQC